MKLAVCILGATGSIGTSTLSVISHNHDKYQVHSVIAHKNYKKLIEICHKYSPKYAVLTDISAATQFRSEYKGSTQLLTHDTAVIDCATDLEVHTVVSAMVGAKGLLPTFAAAAEGKRVLLANKESLVVAGPLLMQTALSCGASIVPVDSEHNAILQALPESYKVGTRPAGVSKLHLTASGGPFWSKPDVDFNTVTPAQACSHPNWSMGSKITVDSATMMNKGLELIEARWLFDMPAEDLNVLVHQQSIIHSLVEYCDGSLVAQLGLPDMSIPIAYALSYPARTPSGAKSLDLLSSRALTFEKPDLKRFPCLYLAQQVLTESPDKAVVLNAANEVAVEGFLKQSLSFADIPVIVEKTLSRVQGVVESLDAIMSLDSQSRGVAQQLMGETCQQYYSLS
ncbi:MAG: 1-deoxy-D-xylulose-5-phosphate reductoisomerase [Legionellales bacterium]|nr:1-deoxy-D-xylulose-5-phosphate reductoisomerase [Legionellales bacterium]|tara:strand:+ start:339 stop:1529 length:1191 start_codon:yes stop_codon:yes gene_type:complete